MAKVFGTGMNLTNISKKVVILSLLDIIIKSKEENLEQKWTRTSIDYIQRIKH